MDIRTGLFTDILPSGAGFITFADGRQAFALPSLIRKVGLQLGDEVECRLAPNFSDKITDRVPWRALHVFVLRRSDTTTTSTRDMGTDRGMEEVSASCYELLESRGGAWTAEEIAEELGAIDTRFVSRALIALFRRNRVCECVLRRGLGDGSPEVFYSVEPDSLLPVGVLEDDEEDTE